MRIPFDVKYRPQIESGEYKVEIRDGSPVRIICWDAKGRKPIIALIPSVTDAEEEVTLPLYTNGRFSSDGAGTVYDLFIVTSEEELNVFEEGLNAFLFDFVHTTVDEDPIDYVKKNSGVLLSFARQKLIKDGYVIEKKAFHDAVKKVDPEVMKEVSKNIDNTERTEFEQELINFFNEGNAILPDKDGMYNKRDCEEFLHKSASKLLAIAEKELTTKYKVSSDYNGLVYGQGYKAGMEDALKEKSRNITANLLDSKITGIQHELIQFASNIMEAGWKDIIEAADSYAERIKAHVLKDLPRWKRFTPNVNDPLSEQQICKELENSVLQVDVGGYCWVISREDLNKLPKEDEK